MSNSKEQVQQLFQKGSEFLQGGNPADALNCFRQLQLLVAPNPTVFLYAGTALHNLGRFIEAISSYRQALELAPDTGEIHNNLGNSLMATGNFPEAAESFAAATRLLPSNPVPLTALATAQQALGKIAGAESSCRSALSLAPDFAEAHWNLALNLLLQGRYAEGWREYEWRWRRAAFTSPVRHINVQQWDGSALEGKTILLHAEQGFGDAIQFVRYVSLVAKLGGSVLLECHPELVSLFQGVEGVQTVLPFGESLPDADYQISLLSLPHILGTTVDNIPSKTPYLSPSSGHRSKWAHLLTDYRDTLRIGLIWAGKSYPDPLRSCRLSDLAPLAAVGNSTFFSLQLGPGAEQMSCKPPGMKLIDLTAEISDFSDTAALIEQLDLVISIDTATAHLAGALGKPTWLLLPYAPDWRWLLKRADSPWYPGMRLFRQETSGKWDTVINKVAMAFVQNRP
ncbi:MAG: tetratricopeptide repeat protein [Geobacter sp.]|nr:tetratricopeptide repeat protein [Geobacter sp.]